MPPKKAATPAAPAGEKKTASPKVETKTDNANNNNKGEKGAAQQKNPPKQQHQNVAEKEKGTTSSPAGEKRVFELSEDPEEAAIQKKLNSLDDKITQHRTKLGKMRDAITAKQQKRDEMQNEKNQLFPPKKKDEPAEGDAGEASASKPAAPKEADKASQYKQGRVDINNKLTAARDAKRLKLEEIKKMRTQIGGSVPLDSKDYLKQLDARIKELEAQQSSGSVSQLAEEKKIIAEIGKCQQSKKLYKSYVDLNDAYKEFDKKIDALEEERRVLNVEADAFFAQRKTEFAGLDERIKSITNIREEIKKDQADRDAVQVEIDKLREQQVVVKNELKEFREKKRDARQAQRDKERQEYQAEKERKQQLWLAEKQKREDDKKAREMKRKQEELEQIPFSDELDLCDALIKYLTPLAPKKPKEGTEGTESPAPAAATPPPIRDNAPEGTPLVRELEDQRPLAKRGGKKKAQKPVDLEKELKHNMETFVQFESVSIVPPSKLAEVDKSIQALKDKKEYYQKKSEEKRAKQKAEIEAALAGKSNPTTTDESKAEDNTTTTTTAEEPTPADA